MNVKSGIYKGVYDFQEKTLNSVLILLTLLAVIFHFLSVIRSISVGISNVFIFQTVLVIGLAILTYFRKNLSLSSKILLLSLFVITLSISGLYTFGFMASGKMYVAFLPIFASFILTFRRAIILLVISLLIYAIFGYLFVSGNLQYTFDIVSFASEKGVWILEFGVLLTISLGLIFVSHKYVKVLKENYNKIEVQNSELENHRKNLEELVNIRTADLELAIEELKTTNDELFDKNEIIKVQNKDLSSALKNLKEAQSQLLQSEKMASLGILTSGVAHEINNPLNYIMGSYYGFENYFMDINIKDKKIDTLLNGLKTGVDRAANIVKGLNQFSRNNKDFDEECDLHSILDNCLLMLNNQLVSKIEVYKNYFDEQLIFSGNTGKIHQVFVNILTNAIQAIPDKGAITISTIKREDKIEIEVSDTGIGISKENLSKITTPFFTTKDPGKGTGLGLSITYSIIQDHSGSIEFESEENKGTTVNIQFPL